MDAESVGELVLKNGPQSHGQQQLLRPGVQKLKDNLFSVCGNQIKIPSQFSEEQLEPLFSGTSWGNIVWDASVVLAEYLATEFPPNEIVGKVVCELGAGFGLPGLACAMQGAKHTMLTDQMPELQGTRSLLAANQAVIPSDSVSAVPLSWGTEQAKTLKLTHWNNTAPDIIIVSDCVSVDVYGADSVELLLQTIMELAGPNTVLLLCSRRRQGDGLNSVMEQLNKVFKFHDTLVGHEAQITEAVPDADVCNIEIHKWSGAP